MPYERNALLKSLLASTERCDLKCTCLVVNCGELETKVTLSNKH